MLTASEVERAVPTCTWNSRGVKPIPGNKTAARAWEVERLQSTSELRGYQNQKKWKSDRKG